MLVIMPAPVVLVVEVESKLNVSAALPGIGMSSGTVIPFVEFASTKVLSVLDG